MNILIRRSLTALILGFMVFASPLAMAQQNVVISLQQDPADEKGGGLEAACVALQLGAGLLMKGAADETDVKVFATLDGVYIADAETYGYRPCHPKFSAVPHKPPYCDTYVGGVLDEKPLEDVLRDFLDEGGEILLCPLCYQVRGAFPIMKITLTSGNAVPVAVEKSPMDLLLDADKVIDF